MAYGSVITALLLVFGVVAALEPAGEIWPYDAALCAADLECGYFTVPLDWHDRDTGNGTIKFARSPATSQRKGTIFIELGIALAGTWGSPDVNLLTEGVSLREHIGPEYDVVLLAARGKDFEGSTNPGPLHCFDTQIAKWSFIRNLSPPEYGFGARGSWDYEMKWTRPQNSTDAHHWYLAQRKLIEHCLAKGIAGKDVQKYVGTAATARDIIAMADAFDGLGAPVNFWGIFHGGIVGAYLLNMFPERIGRIVLDDPVDPIAYTEQQAYLTWKRDIVAANKTIAALGERCASSQSECRFPSSRSPFGASDLLSNLQYTINLMRFDLLGWRAHPAVDEANIAYKTFFDDLRKSLDLSIEYSRHAQGLDRYNPRIIDIISLGTMPIACGDALYDHNPNDTALFAAAEAALTSESDIHSAPLLMSSVFPSYRYLCHLWPLRAVERVAVGPPYAVPIDDKVLVLLRESPDPWNYFSVSEAEARAIWPNATVITGVKFGDTTFNHNGCNLDLIGRYFRDGTVPDPDMTCSSTPPKA